MSNASVPLLALLGSAVMSDLNPNYAPKRTSAVPLRNPIGRPPMRQTVALHPSKAASVGGPPGNDLKRNNAPFLTT
jgi:hypothetical protein